MKTYTYLFILVLFITSCGRPQEKFQSDIKKSESVLFQDSSSVPDTAKARALINMYTDYAEQFQDDTLSPEYLFRAADLCTGIGEYREAVSYYGKIQRYPNYRKTPVALFLQGFVTENHLNDPANAKSYYEKFIDTYPQHKMTDDARTSLENLGKTPDELIEQFEQHNQPMTDTIAGQQ